MTLSLLTVAIRYEHDVGLGRQRARQLAAGLGFEDQDRVRIATAVSGIARNAFQYAGRGKVEFSTALLPKNHADREAGLGRIRSARIHAGVPKSQPLLASVHA